MERNESALVRTLKYLSLGIASLIVLFPIYSVVVGAFKTQVEYYQSGLAFPDDWFNFDN